MSFFSKSIRVLVVLTATACGVGTVTPPAAVVPVLPRHAGRPVYDLSIHDPGEGLTSALEAYRSGNGNAALALALKVREHYPDTPWYRRSLFLTEQALIRMDRADEADAAMLRVQAEYPAMADYALFILADYHAANLRFSRAAALYEQVMERHPRSLLAVRAAFLRAQALASAGAYAPASDAFEKFLQDNPRSEFCADAGLGLARSLVAGGDPARASRAYRDAEVDCPGTPAEQDIEKELALLKAGGFDVPELTSDELYQRGKNLFTANQYDKAVETFKKLLALDPSFASTPDVLLRTGTALFNLGRRSEAAAALEKLVRDYPRDQRVPDALYWMGKSYSKLNDREKAVQAFRRILDAYPGSEWADDALFLTGNIYREAGDMNQALVFYGRVVTEHPESKFADSALWWKAWARYSGSDYPAAEQALQELVNRYPKSFLVSQARYWQGRAAEKSGNAAKAARYYEKILKQSPYTFYGYRAAERMAGLANPDAAAKTVDDAGAVPQCASGPCADDPAAADENDDGPPVWTAEALKTLSGEPSYTKALELLYLDMKKEAAAELAALQGRLPKKRGALLGLSKTYFELGDYYRSLAIVLRNYERYLDGKGETPQDFWLLAYPEGYWDSIVSYSRKYGQDPYFIAAVIRAESQFRAEALSPAGARGVMQVMPATGAWAAKMVRLAGFAPDRLYDSDTAINLGTWYIAQLMKRFNNDALFVAAAYNAGPDSVSQWLAKSGRGAERDEFVESIPFPETRGYVKKVMRNYAEYQRIYGGRALDAPRPPLAAKGGPGSPAVPVEMKTP